MSGATSHASFPPRPTRKRSVASSAHPEDGGDYCRICRGDGTPEQPLFYPCKCSGSIKFVHQDCLMEWLSHSQKKYCELCKTPFRFTKLYDQSMPETVPFPLFLRQLAIHAVRALARWLRYFLVVFVWLLWLPWTIRQIWRGLFWIADGSWMTAQELRQALAANSPQDDNVQLATQLPETLVAVSAFGSVRLNGSISHTGLLRTVYNALSPGRFLKAVPSMIWRTTTSSEPTEQNISVQSNSTSLSAPVPRQSSLLSDIKAFRSVTRYPLINNAAIDVLEGQLVCILIIAAFILIFLIREWVINQQPIPNVPDPDQREDIVQAAAPAEQPRQVVRRRRRGLRRLADANAQLENRAADRARGPMAPPQPRRAATDNNIVVQNEGPDLLARPQAPPRAASLVPGLQEMEETARQLGMPVEDVAQEVEMDDVQSPPLQRGAFDEMTYVRRNIEESRESNLSASFSEIDNLMDQPLSMEPENLVDNPNSVPEAFMFGSTNSPTSHITAGSPGEFTFRAQSQSTENLSQGNENQSAITQAQGFVAADNNSDWVSVNNDGSIVDAPIPSEVDPAPEGSDAGETVSTGYFSESGDNGYRAVEEPQTFWGRIAHWLWQTDEYIPPTTPTTLEDDAEVVQDLNAEAPFVPARPGRDIVAAAAQAQAEADRNNQLGFDPNDPNAMEDAEDMEGILELIGMEGPIAGMIQNIIFSVFLITLTLSASIWCPYIWGKIALLFMANPVSVFIKAPLYLISRTADVIVDMGLFTLGIMGFFLNHITKVIKMVSEPVLPAFSRFLDTDLLEDMALKLSENSVHRLEKTLSGTLFGLRPDLPTFSMQSHHAMRVFKAAVSDIASNVLKHIVRLASIQLGLPTPRSIFTAPLVLGQAILKTPDHASETWIHFVAWFRNLSQDLKPVSFADEEAIDYSLVSWSTQEKVVCILLGYTFFAFAGFAYLKIAHWVLGLRKDEKVDGFFADVLRQAGGVMKVIVIIGIEMIMFPLYCGIMLDLALLPLFEGATPLTRLNFLVNSPITALFVHWFIGTCYMFHFALFVSMCRKVMRKGVLYFIRDPDDPSFHPVRDVLERPVATQLGKIAFSAFIYGGLLIVCLGGVILSISYIGGILPVHWSSREPRMAFPVDIIFYNLMLPFILRKVDVSAKISKLYEWWFRGIASGLRLSHFLFGAEREEERRPAVFAWRGSLDTLLNDRVPLLAERQAFKQPENPFSDATGGTICVERLLGKISPEYLQEMFGHSNKVVEIKVMTEHDCGFVRFANVHDADNICKYKTSEFLFKGGTFQIHRTQELDQKLAASENKMLPIIDGTWVRAPATDSVRIPKGTPVFLQVNEQNERLDGKEDVDVGLHGKTDERFKKLYVPPHFRARIATFIVLVWVFAATTGTAFTLGPLLVGRAIIRGLADHESSPNDLYAFTIGLHVCGSAVYAAYFVWRGWENGLKRAKDIATNTRELVPRAIQGLKYVLGLVYMGVTFGVILPFTISLLSELFVHMPLYSYLLSEQQSSSQSDANLDPDVSKEAPDIIRYNFPFTEIPAVYVLQTWTLGFLYLRILIRVFANYPTNNTQAAVAMRSILRNGLLHPDVKLATRAFVFPVLTVSIILLGSPLLLARVVVALSKTGDTDYHAQIYRHAYPCVLFTLVGSYMLFRLNKRIRSWRIKIRDEVYLIGERLHNFQGDKLDTSRKGKTKVTVNQEIPSTAEQPTSFESQSFVDSNLKGITQDAELKGQFEDTEDIYATDTPTQAQTSLQPQPDQPVFPTRTSSLSQRSDVSENKAGTGITLNNDPDATSQESNPNTSEHSATNPPRADVMPEIPENEKVRHESSYQNNGG